MQRLLPVLLVLAAAAWAADRYDGPRPPKPDLLYLVHADNLIPTEAAEAKDESKKDETTYTMPGVSSPARTPLAEPIFLIDADRVAPDRLELYRWEVKNGRRELSLSKARRKNSNNAKALHLAVTRVDGNLYRVEASEPLENGEYSISPTDSNRVFCFEVF
jgi:hypothetical protein